MSGPLLPRAKSALERGVRELFDRQITDPQRPDCGAVINPAWDLDDPGHGGTAALVSGAVLLRLLEAGDEPLLARAGAALDYMLRYQRPSGRIDMRDCNFDSAPCTAFVAQQFCAATELARRDRRGDPSLQAVLEKIERFVRRAVPGILSGGFHTPNHRWVIASALAQAAKLFAGAAVGSVVDAYLAEGIDLDADGAFLERSVAIYDAVSDRSLLLLAENRDFPGAREAVGRNLEFNLHLLHADATAETGLSRRQDHGLRVVPFALVPCYLHAAALEPNPVFVRAALRLWEQAAAPGTVDLLWLAYVLLKHGEPDAAQAVLPEDFARHFPANGIWRVRRGPLSATAFRDATRLFGLRYGAAELAAVKISQSYFGVGQFVADALEPSGEGVVLRAPGRRGRRPGYEQPLGRPVPAAAWAPSLAQRQLLAVPPCESELGVREIAGGFALRYRTLAGLDRVPAQVALDFAPGGVWQTDDGRAHPRAGEVLFLERGFGAMRYGDDLIEVGPGAVAHRMRRMRDAETAPAHARVLVTLLTPLDYAFEIRARAAK